MVVVWSSSMFRGKCSQVTLPTRQIAGVMVQGRYYARADLDLMLEAVVTDYEAAETTQTVLEIDFPIVVVLFLVALVWFIVRRVKSARYRADKRLKSGGTKNHSPPPSNQGGRI